jgi:uncharacterized protein (DUF433 family)
MKKHSQTNLEIPKYGKERIVSDPSILGGTPVFRGTRIPLDHVVELFRKGVPEREIIEDFSRLTSSDLEYAKHCAKTENLPKSPREELSSGGTSLNRIFRHPELLFVALVIIAPLPAAILWNSTLGFLSQVVLGMAAGLVIWMAIIIFVVWPRYRYS